jgi:hypothetical protein
VTGNVVVWQQSAFAGSAGTRPYKLKPFLACQAKTLMLRYFLGFFGWVFAIQKQEVIVARVSTGGL